MSFLFSIKTFLCFVPFVHCRMENVCYIKKQVKNPSCVYTPAIVYHWILFSLKIQVLDAMMVWVDRLGFDMRLRSTQNDVYEVRIPFPREVTDEKGAKSSFNGMSQLAWEVEKNVQVPEFRKVKQLKKIIGGRI